MRNVTYRAASLMLALTLVLLIVVPVFAAEPDVIGEYAITVTPQSNGNLEMAYSFSNYCATTDFPSDIQGLEVGVPNSHFTIKDFGPKGWVTDARPKTSGGSWVRLDFAKLPKKGDCFNLNFTIVQEQMANLQGEEVTFKLTPGWFDFATIKKLKITWMLPTDASLVHKMDPEAVRTGNQAVWTKENLAPNQKFTVSLVYAKTAFPELSTSVPVETGGETGGGLGAGWIILIIIAIIIIVIVVIFWIGNDSYGGGYTSSQGGSDHTTSTIGAYTTPRTESHTTGSISHTGGSTSSSRPRSGGGGGSFSGRGSSCACVSSCACACACAGGGRVGCSLKKIGADISCLLKRRKSGGDTE